MKRVLIKMHLGQEDTATALFRDAHILNSKFFLGGGGHQVALLCQCRPDSAELLDASADVLAQSRLNVGHFYFFYIGVNFNHKVDY